MMHVNPTSLVPAHRDERGIQQDADIYGSFMIAGNEFALSVSVIQEVVNEPASYTRVPMSPDYLLGLFNLRGMIVPVVDVRSIFGLPTHEADRGVRQVAIIEYGDHCFGLLVDRTGDVFNARDTNKSLFNRIHGDPRESIISGVFKLDNGERLVQILDPFELLKLERLPRVAGNSASALNRTRLGKRKQCISFLVGESVCAFNMTSIQEIVELRTIDNTVFSNSWVLGAINLRGNTIPVVDFGAYLSGEQACPAKDFDNGGYKLIVVKVDEGLLGFLVNSIRNIMSYFDNELISFPAVGMDRAEIFQGCLSNAESEMVLILDHDKVFKDHELSELTRGHSRLFVATDDERRTENNNSTSKRTFITFAVDCDFALDITDVNEVMSYTSDIISPPNMPNFIDGVINIRGEIVPVINLRTLYKLESVECKNCKLLVFSKNNKKYAIIVDRMNAIMSVPSNKVTKFPAICDNETSRGISEDVKEIVLCGNSNSDKISVMVLNLESIVNRVVTSA